MRVTFRQRPWREGTSQDTVWRRTQEEPQACDFEKVSDEQRAEVSSQRPHYTGRSVFINNKGKCYYYVLNRYLLLQYGYHIGFLAFSKNESILSIFRMKRPSLSHLCAHGNISPGGIAGAEQLHRKMSAATYMSLGAAVLPPQKAFIHSPTRGLRE